MKDEALYKALTGIGAVVILSLATWILTAIDKKREKKNKTEEN